MIEPTLSFDRSATSLDAIQRAIYRLSDRLSCDLVLGEKFVEVTIHPTDPDAQIEQLLGDLRNDVLDQTLRERVREETSDVRNLILALAFSKTGLVNGDV